MLLTRSPLSTRASPGFSFDLHVLGAPPAFVLSQDQTLHRDLDRARRRRSQILGVVGCHWQADDLDLLELLGDVPARIPEDATMDAALAFDHHCSVFKEPRPDL